jgi:hypothetical protein
MWIGGLERALTTLAKSPWCWTSEQGQSAICDSLGIEQPPPASDLLAIAVRTCEPHEVIKIEASDLRYGTGPKC